MSNPIRQSGFQFGIAAAVSLVVGSLLPGWSTAVAGVHHGSASTCAHAKHRYVDAKSATVKAKVITVHTHPATFHCGGPDDGFYKIAHRSETLTVKSDAVIKVFQVPESPTGRKTVKASKLPHWLKHNKSEPIYQIAGPVSAITKMTEQFHP
jgi:hypothetical protein